MRHRLTRLEARIAREGSEQDRLRVLGAIACDEPIPAELAHVRLPLALIRSVLDEEAADGMS